ncbi:MAG: hypothetical protein QOE30_184 [Mycobacterium sp.]|uniref:hypothetical protein n=1 Tax=Mycobacterium sp. TaxID=1785 RepID=UPI0028B543A2|nr:hypothetical protein [Mycobacterium sp.]MDT5114445.1 hypothetical protein [Mycobacterium sp.]
MDEGLQNQTEAVLRTLARARTVFGSDELPVDPPAFGAPADLEDDLGAGRY